jgi:hypothetical protein
MTLWDKSIALVIDVDKHEEPLVEVDANGVWDSTHAGPWRFGDNPVLKIQFAQIAADGTATILQQGAGASVSVVGKQKGPNGEMTGDVLFSISSLASEGEEEEEWSGELNLFTTELETAISDYAKLPCRVEVTLAGVYEVSYQFDVTIMNAVNTGIATNTAALDYLTDAELQALVEGYVEVALEDILDVNVNYKIVVTADGEHRIVER